MSKGASMRWSLEEKHDRTWARYHEARAAREASMEAVSSACRVFEQTHDQLQRMMDWIKLPDRLTPFPWVGDEYIEPCNARDLDYYEGRPDKCPPEVREWYARYQAFRLPECNHHPADMCDACDAVWELGTMRSAGKGWFL
jgi:hypothetical protein